MSFEVMKVVIRGQMPESCYDCPYAIYDDEADDYVCLAKIVGDNLILDVRNKPDFCPIIEDGENLIDWVFDRHGIPIDIDKHLYGE